MNPRLYVNLTGALLVLALVALAVRFTLLGNTEVPPLVTGLLFISGFILIMFALFSTRLRHTLGSYIGDVFVTAAGAATAWAGASNGWDVAFVVFWFVLLGLNVFLLRFAWGRVPEENRTRAEILEFEPYR